MFIKRVDIIGYERTGKYSRDNFEYIRYFATAPVNPEKGEGDAVFTFSDTESYVIGDELDIAYQLRQRSDKSTYSLWEPLKK